MADIALADAKEVKITNASAKNSENKLKTRILKDTAIVCSIIKRLSMFGKDGPNKANLLKINAWNFDDYVLASELPSMIAFGADWLYDSLRLCDCLEWYCHRFDGKMIVGYADIDYVPELFYRYNVTVFPTVIIFEDGELFTRLEGFEYREQIDDLIYRFFGYLPYDPKAKRF